MQREFLIFCPTDFGTLRYNGLFADKANFTTGLYYFTNEINYHERRNLLGIATGGTFSPLAKGRYYGAEVTYNFF
ncbi:MAG: hypothetical protein O7F73_16820 [Gammaproteobacteria bacterium]|nr:hypothetical protein [Gammaproteobacteria bacterium]